MAKRGNSMPETNERLASIEGQLPDIKNGLGEIKGILERSGQERTLQYTQMVKEMATMSANSSNYQKDCDDERRDHETRIRSMETSLTKLATKIAIWGSFGGIGAAFLTKAIFHI